MDNSSTEETDSNWPQELLMEKLRSKASEMKSFSDTSEAMLMALQDEDYVLDEEEKALHRKCLDTLQHSIKVTSVQTLVGRLECLARKLGLGFGQAPSGVVMFVTSDMFYIEIALTESGTVCDVIVHHDGSNVHTSCEELISCLTRKEFSGFTAHLEGFLSIYQLNVENEVKSMAFTALQSLEADLNMLWQLQTLTKDPFNLLHKSPLGVLEKRRGGHAMRLTYFASPYDLIDTERSELEPFNVETILKRQIGYSATVYLDRSTAHKLQTSTLVNDDCSQSGKNTPTYAPLTSKNSVLIPVCFVLRLNRPLPICVELLRRIHDITELECADLSNASPIMGLIAQHAGKGQTDAYENRGWFVNLLDQTHCYFMIENISMQGLVVSRIPFTHPAHVAPILVFLRQQALLNTLIASCIRLECDPDMDNLVILEGTLFSGTKINISLEHSLEQTLASAEFDLSDISNLKCKIHSSLASANASEVVSELSSKILNMSFSIPITIRSVLHHWKMQLVNQNSNLPLSDGDPGGTNNHSRNSLGETDSREPTGHDMPFMSPHEDMSLMGDASFTECQADGAIVTNVLTNLEISNIPPVDKPKRKKRKRKSFSSKRRVKRKQTRHE